MKDYEKEHVFEHFSFLCFIKNVNLTLGLYLEILKKKTFCLFYRIKPTFLRAIRKLNA